MMIVGIVAVCVALSSSTSLINRLNGEPDTGYGSPPVCRSPG